MVRVVVAVRVGLELPRLPRRLLRRLLLVHRVHGVRRVQLHGRVHRRRELLLWVAVKDLLLVLLVLVLLLRVLRVLLLLLLLLSGVVGVHGREVRRLAEVVPRRQRVKAGLLLLLRRRRDKGWVSPRCRLRRRGHHKHSARRRRRRRRRRPGRAHVRRITHDHGRRGHQEHRRRRHRLLRRRHQPSRRG